jgi:hypothetical protein
VPILRYHNKTYYREKVRCPFNVFQQTQMPTFSTDLDSNFLLTILLQHNRPFLIPSFLHFFLSYVLIFAHFCSFLLTRMDVEKIKIGCSATS